MSHNLDIESYTFYEILELFDLDAADVKLEDMKRAKRKVLMLHPDKSKLPKEYFLFYKKAYDVVWRMYENLQKVVQKVEEKEYYVETDIKVKQSIEKLSPEMFQKNFNQLFDKHMAKPLTNKNEWFSRDEPLFQETVSNKSEMESALDRIKEQQNKLIKHNGVLPIFSSSKGNSFLYEGDDDSEYVYSDLFGKLKYDDLRKVHKDETVFAVRESDMKNVPRYSSIDEYERARDVRGVIPTDRSKALHCLEQQELLLHQRMREKQFKSELDTLKNIESNKSVMANFLRLN